jgi:hypothetical protein
MSVREEGRSYALPKRAGEQMDEQAAALIRTCTSRSSNDSISSMTVMRIKRITAGNARCG